MGYKFSRIWLLLLYVILGTGHSLHADWADDVLLSANDQRNDQAQVAIDANGNEVAVWRWNNGITEVIQASTRTPGGSWSTAETISDNANNASNPQVAIDSSGNATAIWRWYNSATSKYIIQTSTREAGGSWSAPETLSDINEQNDSPQILVDSSGNATAIWRVTETLPYILKTTTKPAGGSWSSVTQLSSTQGGSILDPKAVVDPLGNITLIWRSALAAYYLEATTSHLAVCGRLLQY